MDEIDSTLRLLKTDRIDIGWLTALHLTLTDGPVETAMKAKEQGKLRFIGVTGHEKTQVIETLKNGDVFDVMLFPYSYGVEGGIEYHFPMGKQRDMGIIGIKPFASGSVRASARSTNSWRREYATPGAWAGFLKYILRKRTWRRSPDDDGGAGRQRDASDAVTPGVASCAVAARHAVAGFSSETDVGARGSVFSISYSPPITNTPGPRILGANADAQANLNTGTPRPVVNVPGGHIPAFLVPRLAVAASAVIVTITLSPTHAGPGPAPARRRRRNCGATWTDLWTSSSTSLRDHLQELPWPSSLTDGRDPHESQMSVGQSEVVAMPVPPRHKDAQRSPRSRQWPTGPPTASSATTLCGLPTHDRNR
jgi:hypothetical protein